MKRFVSLLLAVLVMLGSIAVLSAVNIFAASASITYSFKNNTAGYAQGTVTLKGDNGTYYLYWADDIAALDGYAEITSLTVSAGQGSFTMPQYTAIPADATKLIAFMATTEPAEANRTVAKASAVYNIPASKQLAADSSDALYTFGAISDPQLANDSYGSNSYPYDEEHLAAALETLAQRGVDFTISSGDTVNDQNGNATYAAEFKRYQRILADSSYAAPIYEANGNHDVGTVWDKNGNYYNDNTPFVKGTGLDSVKSTITAGKPYFEVTEPTTGDHFIFMALEGGFYTNKGTQFSTAQLDWLEGLLKKYSGDGKNIFIIEHGNIAGWGAGDKLTAPYYYDLGLVKTNSDVARFIKLMETYKDCVVISGHTHLELSAQYNYCDNGGTSAVTIHNSAIGGVRRLVNGSVDRAAVKGLSEGYIVEVYEDCVLFNGTNMYYNEVMPQCSYIVPMGTSEKSEDTTTPTEPATETVRITLMDKTAEGWMSNNATEREIQLIDNETGTKYVMTSYDGYQSWWVEVPRSVTDITFKRVRISDNVDRNVWSAGERNGSVVYCVLDDAGGGTTEGNGYWDMSLREPTRPATESTTETTVATVPVTKPTEATTVTEPTETTSAKTEPSSTAENTENTEPSSSPATSAATDPTETTGGETTASTPAVTESTATIATTTASTAIESVPADTDYLYGDADLNGKINVKDATTVQKYAAKMLDLDGLAFTQADVTGDLKVNVKDATSIQKLIAKIIDKFPVEESELVSVGALASGTWGYFNQDLEDYYTYSSYDQYMALKKACMKYKNVTLTDAMVNELYALQEALYDIAGEKPAEGGEITVYFDNTKNWSKVYIYAWADGGGNIVSWPGEQMTHNGDYYSYTFNYDEYQNIIFNNGNGEQTVDIAHPGYNCLLYKITGGPTNKYTVDYYDCLV